MGKYMKILLLLLPTLSWGFYLSTNTGAAFKDSHVKVYITSNSTCTQTGYTKEEILNFAVVGAQKFWNDIPSSTLKVSRGGILETADNNYLTGRLCLISDSECNSGTAVPGDNDIVIACNGNTTDNFKSSSYLALSAPNNVSGKNIKGSVILVNDSGNSAVSTLSSAEMISLMAHEVGHAVGLGHSEKDEALMYYKNSENRRKLSQDDIDGVSYLYPNKLDGCTSFIGSISDRGDATKSFLFGLFFILFSFAISRIRGWIGER